MAKPPNHLKMILWYTHYGTPFLKLKAYKARVGGVSFQCEIEQIHVGGTQVDPCPFQSKQYLIGGRDESPPTIYIYNLIFRSNVLFSNVFGAKQIAIFFSQKTNRNLVIEYINIMVHFCRFFFFFCQTSVLLE